MRIKSLTQEQNTKSPAMVQSTQTRVYHTKLQLLSSYCLAIIANKTEEICFLFEKDIKKSISGK